MYHDKHNIKLSFSYTKVDVYVYELKYECEREAERGREREWDRERIYSEREDHNKSTWVYAVCRIIRDHETEGKHLFGFAKSIKVRCPRQEGEREKSPLGNTKLQI
jgi:hypothetical protein